MSEPVFPADESPQSDAPLREFGAIVHALTPRTFVTPFLVAVNVGVFVVMLARGVDPFRPLVVDLLNWGGNFAPLTLSGEWYRLLTCMFLHAGLMHIGFNMWVLWDAGRMTEKLTGNTGFAILYLQSGLAASLTSLVWNPRAVGVGASGAVFGVVGAMLGFVMLRRSTIPDVIYRQLWRSVGTFIVLNLIIGMSMPQIDLAAHAGGFVAGVLAGLILSRPVTMTAARQRIWRNLALLIVGTAGLLLAVSQLPRGSAPVMKSHQTFAVEEQAALKGFDEAFRQLQVGKLTEPQLADLVERDVIPVYEAQGKQLAAVRNVPAEDAPLHTLYISYSGRRLEQFELLVKAVREQSAAAQEESLKKKEEADELLGQMQALIKKRNDGG